MANDGGLPRRIDQLGRIVIPVELRRLLGIKPGDELDIAIRGDALTLAKSRLSCVFCGAEDRALTQYRDRMVCRDCARESWGQFDAPGRTG